MAVAVLSSSAAPAGAIARTRAMARKQGQSKPASRAATQAASSAAARNGQAAAHNGAIRHAAARKPANGWSEKFSRMASETARLAGKPLTFLVAALAVAIWAASGPLFGYSDTWQLVINTSTTIITFLMVFLIQHTQNRDTMALQLKLAELIIAARGTKNSLATAEDMSEEDLERLHEVYRARAEETLAHLNRRRGEEMKKVS
jgi:low affinity Fe/Cu permease